MKYLSREFILLYSLLVVIPILWGLSYLYFNSTNTQEKYIEDELYRRTLTHNEVNILDFNKEKNYIYTEVIQKNEKDQSTTSYMLFEKVGHTWYGKNKYKFVTVFNDGLIVNYTEAKYPPYEGHYYINGINNGMYEKIIIHTSWGEDFEFDVSSNQFIYITDKFQAQLDDTANFNPIESYEVILKE